MDDEKLIDKWKKETSKHEGAWSNKSLYRIIKMTREDERERLKHRVSYLEKSFGDCIECSETQEEENNRLRKGIENGIKILKGRCRCHTLKQAKCVFCVVNQNLKKLLEKGDD